MPTRSRLRARRGQEPHPKTGNCIRKEKVVMRIRVLTSAALIISSAAPVSGQIGAVDAAKVEVLCPADECHTATCFKGSVRGGPLRT